MSKRVLVLVQRSGGGTHVTDRTPTVVWEHEVPILDEIHGSGSCEVIEDFDDLLDKDVRENRDSQVKFIAESAGLGKVFDGDPRDEYNRLIGKYGMHPNVQMPVIEKVYGPYRDGRFEEIFGSKGYDTMTSGQLRELCDKLGINYAGSTKKAELITMIKEKEAA